MVAFERWPLTEDSYIYLKINNIRAWKFIVLIITDRFQNLKGNKKNGVKIYGIAM